MLEIPRAFDRPVRFDNEAYIRIGPHTTKLKSYPEKEKLLWHLSESTSFETEVAIGGVQDDDVLSLLDYESYFTLMQVPIPPNTSGILKVFQDEQLIRQRDDRAWNILNLGYLTFARNLSEVDAFRHKSVRIARYSGSFKNQIYQEELSVSYASGFTNIVDRVVFLALTSETFNGGIRKQEPKFPVAAVREVIANALIHQGFTVRYVDLLIEMVLLGFVWFEI